MTPLIARDAARFDPIYGDTRYRVAPRLKRRVARASPSPVADPEAATKNAIRRFTTAFVGGFVFFSVFIS